MDYGKALTFVFDDPRWVTKVAIGVGLLIAGTLVAVAVFAVGLLASIPLTAMTDEYGAGPVLGIGFVMLIFCLMLLAVVAYLVGYVIVRGYVIRLLQNVRDGLEAPLPEWNQWSLDLVRGVKSVAVNVVWGLPFLIVFVPFFCIIPLMLLGMADAAEGGGEDVMAVFGMQAAIWCMIPVMLLVQVLYQLFAPGFTIAFARHERISDGLGFPTIIRWTWGNIRLVASVALVAFGVAYAINTIAAMAGLFLCFVGVLVMAPVGALFATLYTHHLYGQLAVHLAGGPTGISAPPAELALSAPAAVEVLPTAPVEPPMQGKPPAA